MLGEVTLTSGKTACYYVDAKRAILRQPGFGALGELVAAEADRRGASAVGGMTMGADPIASAAIADPGGRDLLAFFVRKEKKQHGLQRWVEGPLLERRHPGADRRGRRHHRRLDGEGDRALPRGGPRDRRHRRVLDRLAGGGESIDAAAGGGPYTPLATIDDVHPERDDRA